MCLAKDVMTSNPSVCREENTIMDVVRVMNREDCGVVPVVDAMDHCVGIITDRDICLKTVLDYLDPEDTPVSEIMTTPIVTCEQTDPIETVIARMEKEQIRRIPVVDEEQCLVGIISEGDLAKSEVKERVSELVEAVVQ
ncbi:CBS domain-containing protein [Vampirovibrio sp.]|uniref:CBS domain-containing protein n=1 Tax=Vampirovibrio sp. TaxID=2717857 RepID=UPI00359420D6